MNRSFRNAMLLLMTLAGLVAVGLTGTAYLRPSPTVAYDNVALEGSLVASGSLTATSDDCTPYCPAVYPCVQAQQVCYDLDTICWCEWCNGQLICR